MHQQWVHREHIIAPVQEQRHGNRSDQVAVDLKQVTQPVKINFLALMLIAVVITLLTTVPLLVVKLRHRGDPAVIAAEIPLLRGSAVEIRNKKEFLSRLSTKQRSAFTYKAHYIAGIIRSTNNPEIDSYELAYKIVFESHNQNYDPLFVSAVILAESTFRKDARSSVGALGLMQIRPSTGAFISRLNKIEWKGARHLRVPEYNIKLGIAYLKHLNEMYNGDIKKTLMAYNWGPGNLNQLIKYRKKRIPRATQRYYKKISKYYAHWKHDFRTKELNMKYGNMLRIKG